MFVMAHDNEPLVPAEMQVRRNIRISVSVTVSMLRGLLAWLDRLGYEYKIEDFL